MDEDSENALNELLTAIVVGGIFLVSYFPVNWFINERYKAPPEERALEKRLDTAFVLPDMSIGTRIRFIGKFEVLYNEFITHWDYAERQIDLLRKITIYDSERLDRVGSAGNRRMIMYSNFFGDGAVSGSRLAHELAHIWHDGLQNKEDFEDAWMQIVEGNYYQDSDDNALNDGISLNDVRVNLGLVSPHAARSLKQDVAEVVEVVYLINNPHRGLEYFPNNNYNGNNVGTEYFQFNIKTVQNTIGKVRLLEQYEFISPREARLALQELRGYSTVN